MIIHIADFVVYTSIIYKDNFGNPKLRAAYIPEDWQLLTHKQLQQKGDRYLSPTGCWRPIEHSIGKNFSAKVLSPRIRKITHEEQQVKHNVKN